MAIWTSFKNSRKEWKSSCDALIIHQMRVRGLTITSVNPVHNAPRLSVTGPGVQADRARRGGWGRKYVVTGPGIQANRARRGGWRRERSVTDRPGPALPDFDRPGPAWGGGGGEVCYRQTRPDFSPAALPASPFPHPPKPPSQTKRLIELIY
jgi:hypothetical protein